MAKQKRKTRRDPVSPEPTPTPSPPSADAAVMTLHTGFRVPRGLSDPLSASMTSFDNVHSPFFLHCGDHPGNLDLSTYYIKKKTLWEQLANTKASTVKRCNCDHVKELLEEAETSRIIQFLMGLNDNFANIRGQILNMKPRPGLTEIYNMLVGGGGSSTFSPSAAFQVQASPVDDSSAILLSQGSYQKPQCSHCNRLGHTAEKCYKLHGYPPGSQTRWKKPQTIGNANLATTQLQAPAEQKIEGSAASSPIMSNDQIQTMISYLSSKLHVSTVDPTPDKPCASTSTSVPVISQISGTFLDLYSNSYYDMLVSSISKEPAVSPRVWVIDSGATHHVRPCLFPHLDGVCR
ncbi:unnamed protein product [Microthlaspi erraticum]|uniref:CCHC-type domain-containing protein n=1 Tax=Microthlaspi erraticum TaxID=1685480 RepID=A0A6D2INK4_9BRAS|nr:unnamed protein product [Microthlaspi erraticum]